MTVTVFRCVILTSIDFYDFVSPFPPQFQFRLRRYIKHSRHSFIGYPNASNFVKNYSATRRIFNSLLGLWKCGQTLYFVFHVIYQTRETVFHRNIQTTRRELKIQRAAEYFSTKFEVFGQPMKRCLEFLIYLLNRNKN